MSKPIMPAGDTCLPARAPRAVGHGRRRCGAGIGTPDLDELDRWANRLARMLVEEGAGPGSWIVTAGLPSAERAVTRWAIAKVGATATPTGSTNTRRRPRFGVTTRAARPGLDDDITWLVLDERTTLVRYLTGSDAPLTPAELGTAHRMH